MEELEQWKKKLDQLHKEESCPWWRLQFGYSLLKKAEEFLLVDQNKEAKAVFKRLESWMQRVSGKSSSAMIAQSSQKRFTKPVLANLKSDLKRASSLLSRYKAFIPRMEEQVFREKLRDLNQQSLEWAKNTDVNFGNIEEFGGDGLQLRKQLLQRLRRSLRAQNLASSGILVTKKTNSDVTQEASGVNAISVGPYNNRKNLSEAISLIGERDPIWVEDFLQCYNHLFELESKLVRKK